MKSILAIAIDSVLLLIVVDLRGSTALLLFSLMLSLDNLLAHFNCVFFNHIHIVLKFVQSDSSLRVLITIVLITEKLCITTRQSVVSFVADVHVRLFFHDKPLSYSTIY